MKEQPQARALNGLDRAEQPSFARRTVEPAMNGGAELMRLVPRRNGRARTENAHDARQNAGSARAAWLFNGERLPIARRDRCGKWGFARAKNGRDRGGEVAEAFSLGGIASGAAVPEEMRLDAGQSDATGCPCRTSRCCRPSRATRVRAADRPIVGRMSVIPRHTRLEAPSRSPGRARARPR